MFCKLIKVKGDWADVLASARTTINKPDNSTYPSSAWRKQILLSEHSPIRQISVKAKWIDLKSWVSVHLVRHWLGIIHWVRSQRDDRASAQSVISRDDMPQSTLIEHEIEVNAQAIINISRKRLCSCASKETREAWKAFLATIYEVEPELWQVAVRECVYRGFCPEFKCCGYVDTEDYSQEVHNYRIV